MRVRVMLELDVAADDESALWLPARVRQSVGQAVVNALYDAEEADWNHDLEGAVSLVLAAVHVLRD